MNNNNNLKEVEEKKKKKKKKEEEEEEKAEEENLVSNDVRDMRKNIGDEKNQILIFLSMLFWHFLFFWQHLLWLTFFFAHRAGYDTLIIIFISWYFFNVFFEKSPYTGEATWLLFAKSWIVEYAGEWFPLNMVKTTDIDPSNQYIFSIHPHGLMPWSIHPFGKTKQWEELFPNVHCKVLAASIIFKIPVAREAALWTGGIDAGASTAERMVSQGYSIGILTGGSDEMIECQPGKEVAFIKKRRGFIRLAYKYGCHLVPCYCFGANDLYHQFPYFKDLRIWILRKTRVAMTFGWGRTFFNLLPAKIPINIVVGEPIAVEKIENPTEEQIEEMKELYIQKLSELFEQHKARYGYQDRKLIIL